MKFNLRMINKKAVTIGLSAGVALGISGAAFAFFTSTGTGSGSGVTGTAGNNIVVTGTETVPIFPGGTGGPVGFTVANSAAVPEQLSNIHLASYTVDPTHVTAGCSVSLGVYTMADVPVTQADGKILAHATNQALTAAGSLFMTDTLTNQNACEGATLTLTFTTS
jgi:hypothetical protein